MKRILFLGSEVFGIVFGGSLVCRVEDLNYFVLGLGLYILSPKGDGD